MKTTNYVLQHKYCVSATVRSLTGSMMASKELAYRLKYQDVSVKASDYQDAKVQSKKLRVFDIVEALDAVMLRLKKANIATSQKQRNPIPLLEKAFSELSKAIKEMHDMETK